MNETDLSDFLKTLSYDLYTNTAKANHLAQSLNLTHNNEEFSISVGFSKEDKSDPQINLSLDAICENIRLAIRASELFNKQKITINNYIYQREPLDLFFQKEKKKYLSKIYSFLYQYDYIKTVNLTFIGRVLLFKDINNSNLSFLNSLASKDSELKKTMLVAANIKEEELNTFINDFDTNTAIQLPDSEESMVLSLLCKDIQYNRDIYESILK